MGCWNFTFWDNDDCVEFLLVLFSHLGLSAPLPEKRTFSVQMIVSGPSTPFGPGPPLLVRHSKEEFDETRRIFHSLAASTFESAKETDPDLEEKLFAELQKWGAAESLLSQLGLEPKHLWSLIHMHVGLPVEVEKLDSLAHAFDTRDKGGTYNIHPYLKSFTSSTPQELESLRNSHAPHIRKGVLLYKSMMEQGIALQPKQMAYIGPHVSIVMWMSGSLPHALNPESGYVWRGTPELFIEHERGNGKFQLLFAMTRSLLVMYSLPSICRLSQYLHRGRTRRPASYERGMR
jgi:hypothetical protein